jgi:SAM-dependent methyltransferase
MNFDSGSCPKPLQRMLPEFDRHSPNYDELLRDPLRDVFTGQQSAFFHIRKRDLILRYFHQRRIDTHSLRYLDIGCGKGDLLSLLQTDFIQSVGCDTSFQMTSSIRGLNIRLQDDPETIPFESRSYDFVTAVCVYHHVRPAARPALTREVSRILRPNGIFAIIEHNPCNPVTRLIVSRTSVDSNAILLRPSEVHHLMKSAGFSTDTPQYFLYFPKKIYEVFPSLENGLSRIPLGGQYAVFGSLRPSAGCE